MAWWRNWSRSSRQSSALGILTALVFLWSVSALAQESFEQRYQRAKDLYDHAKMEEACEALTVLNKEKPADKPTQMYLSISCQQLKNLQKTEDNLFNQGVQLFNQGQLEDAQQKFQQSQNPTNLAGLKTFRHKEEALGYIKQIDTRLKQAAAQKEAAQRAQQDAAQKAAAQKAAEEKAQREAAQRAAAQKEPEKKATAKKETPKAPKEVASGPSTQPSATPPEQPIASDETLRAGLRAYFSGDLQEAERSLTEYLKNNGQKQGLAYFFRGAAHSTVYFLSGEKDSSEKEQAVADFRSAKSRGQEIQPAAKKYISPKILALYSQTP